MALALYRSQYLNRYSGMRLSKFWLLVMPTLPIILYNFLDKLGIFTTPPNEAPRAITLSLGVTIYYIFSETIANTSGALDSNKNYIHRTGIKPEACYLSAIYETLTNFAIRYVACAAIILLFDYQITIQYLLFGLIGIVFALASAGVGIILSIFVVFYRDTINIIQTLLFYLLFASGVFGRVGEGSDIYQIISKIPTYIAVQTLKNYSLGLPLENWTPFFITVALGFVVLVLAGYAYKNAKNTVISFLK